jgi:hypothetical protein
MVAKVFEHIKGFEGVWFPRHDELADWVFQEARTA